MRDWKFVCLILLILSLPAYIYLSREVNIFGLTNELWGKMNKYIALPIVLMLELFLAGVITHKDQKLLAMGVSVGVILPLLIVLSFLV